MVVAGAETWEEMVDPWIFLDFIQALEMSEWDETSINGWVVSPGFFRKQRYVA